MKEFNSYVEILQRTLCLLEQEEIRIKYIRCIVKTPGFMVRLKYIPSATFNIPKI